LRPVESLAAAPLPTTAPLGFRPGTRGWRLGQKEINEKTRNKLRDKLRLQESVM